MKKVVLIAVAVLFTVLLVFSSQKSIGDSLVEEITEVEVPNVAEDVQEEDAELVEESKPLEQYVFGVKDGTTNKKQHEVNSEYVGELVDDNSVQEYTILEDLEDNDCLILYDIKTVKLEKDLISPGQAVYTWINSDSYSYPIRLTILKDIAYNTSMFYENLSNSEWRQTNGYELIQTSNVISPVGDGKMFVYRVGDSIPTCSTYLQLDNDYVLTLEVNGEFNFNELLPVVEDIIANGITVIINTEVMG